MKALVKLMGLAMGLVMVSCSGYDDEFILEPQQPQQQNNDPKPDDNNKNDDDEWENTTSDWFNMNASYLIDTHKKTNKGEYCAEVQFEATLGGKLYYKFEDKNTRAKFISLENIASVAKNYGEWTANTEGDSIRKVYTSQAYKANLYSRSLDITTGEATRTLNGKPEPFVMPIIVCKEAGMSSDSTQITRNDSIFDRFTITDYVIINFVDQEAPRTDLPTMKVTAETIIDVFIGMKEKETETMPEPSFYVEGEIQWISDRTASPEFTTSNKTHAIWYEVSVIKTTVKTYVVANGQLKDGWNNSELANAEWNSAILDKGYTNKWVPATINMDGSGWTYVLQFSNNEYRPLTVPENLSLMTDLKTFKEDDNASQTPFLTKGVNKRHFANGDFYTVTGKYSYTVAAK